MGDEIEKQKDDEKESDGSQLCNLMEKLISSKPPNKQILIGIIGVIGTILLAIIANIVTPPIDIYNETQAQDNAPAILGEILEISKHAQSYIENGKLDLAELELNKAIKLYNNLSDLNKLQLSQNYGEIYNIIGSALLILAKCKNKEENIEKSIIILNGADNQTIETLSNLGLAYIELSKKKNKKLNLIIALDYLNESMLMLRETDKMGFKFAQLLEYNGTANGFLSNVELKRTNLALSLKDYENAIEIINILNQTNSDNETILRIGIMKGHIGETYRLMAQIGNQRENLEKSIANNSEALDIFKSIGPDPYGLAFLRRNMGSLHLSLSQIDSPLSPKDDPKYHIEEAIENSYKSTHKLFIVKFIY